VAQLCLTLAQGEIQFEFCGLCGKGKCGKEKGHDG
jgi:hypothetical protein